MINCKSSLYFESGTSCISTSYKPDAIFKDCFSISASKHFKKVI